MDKVITSYKDDICYYVDKYGDMILRVAFSYMKNTYDAEDIVQEVFLKLVSNKYTFDNTEHEKAWIIRVTINLCKNKLKSFWFNKTSEMSDEIKYYDKINENDSILKAVMGLPVSYRMVIHLYYYEQYSTKEIADVIGKKESTVRSLLYRGREKLKNILKEEYDFEE